MLESDTECGEYVIEMWIMRDQAQILKQLKIVSTAALIALMTIGSAEAQSRLEHPKNKTWPIADIEHQTSGPTPLQARFTEAAQQTEIIGVSATEAQQILVELGPGDTAPPRPFDLNRRTLEFAPDDGGRYSRSVHPVKWEHHIGEAVADGAEVEFRNFQFPFAGRSWNSFHVNRAGTVTFGGALPFENSRRRTIRDHADNDLAAHPTIAPLYKPYLGVAPYHGVTDHRAVTYLARFPDRVVVTWVSSEPERWPHGIQSDTLSRFQAVLNANGTVRFNYAEVSFGDGVVGLFPNSAIYRGEVLGRIVDETDQRLPGHLDLLDVTIYDSNGDGVIVEWTTRGPIPVPKEGTYYSFRLYLDTDEPFWTRYDRTDRDLWWSLYINSDGHRTGSDGGMALPSDSANRVAMLVNIHDLSGLSVAVAAVAWEFSDDGNEGKWLNHPVRIELPNHVTDLSQPDERFSHRQLEVFRYRSAPDTSAIACRVAAYYGDAFDMMVFHSQFRFDVQQHGSAWDRFHGNTNVQGIGDNSDRKPPCEASRLKGVLRQPWWMWDRRVFSPSKSYHPDDVGFDRGLFSFTHELGHTWTAWMSYVRNGELKPLADGHWWAELQLSVAFPWRTDDTGARGSIMGSGGTYWEESGNGTFTRRSTVRSLRGFSWLDLYAMGLAEPSEVPDMFLVQNGEYIGSGRYKAEKEIVSIEQIIAAEGPRQPAYANAQKDFNVGFVYLLAPGEEPSREPLDLHARFRDEALAHWFHVTGGRSRLTTDIPVPPSR